MRSLSNGFVLVMLVFVGFGFLLSQSLNLYQQLVVTKRELAIRQAELDKLQEKYQALVEERNRLSEQVTGLSQANTTLQARVAELDAERTALRSQIDDLQREQKVMEEFVPLFVWLDSNPFGRLTALVLLPFMPLSFGVFYAAIHRRTVRPTKIQSETTGTIQATLTRDEIHDLAKRRKLQYLQNKTC